jgi:preprotein translocase subunit YajC
MSTNVWLLLAEGGEAPAPGGSALSMLPLLAAIALLFYFMIMKPDQKRAATMRSMRDGLKKNDRVVTAGGIYGVVTNVQRETNEVTIKVDEATNTKLRVTLDSIARVTSDESTSDGGTKSGTAS